MQQQAGPTVLSRGNGGRRQGKNQDSQHSSRHPGAAARTSSKATTIQALQPSATESERSNGTGDIRPSCLPEPVSFSISCRCGSLNKTATATGFNGTPRPRMTSLEAHSSSRKPGTVTSNNSGKRRTWGHINTLTGFIACRLLDLCDVYQGQLMIGV